MSAALWCWIALTGLAGLIWIGRHRQLAFAQRTLPPLRSGLYPDDSAALPSVTMLVAGKDEEANIEACLRSIAGQDYPNLSIVAVNDRSADRTGEIMDRLAAAEPRLKAVHVESLRPGWFGKNNAMREGVERAGGEWLCFTDADCVQTSPRSLRVAMRYALEHDAAFLSVLPGLDTDSFWERVIQPACGGIMMIWFNPLRVNNPRCRAAYANGAFMLMSRACYDAIGGHEPVKTEVNEDMHMARRAKAGGQRLRVVANEDLYAVRMYSSLRQCWAGWSRIFYGCFGTLGHLMLSIAVVWVFSVLPWLALPAGVIGAAVDDGSAAPWRTLAWTAAATAVAQLSVMVRFYALSRSNAAYGLLYPIGAAIGLGALVNATRRLGGRRVTTWRGTTYRGDRVELAARAASTK